MSQETNEETTISQWIKSKEADLKSLEFDKPNVFIVKNETNPWNADNVPEIKHPGADFFRSEPLIMTRDYDRLEPRPERSKIPEEYLEFNSSPGGSLGKSLDTLINELDPLTSILPPPDSLYLKDPRPNSSPIIDSDLQLYKLSFTSINAACDFLCPIILDVFLFDGKIGKRVSETWSFVPPQFHNELSSHEAFNSFLQAPQSISLAINRPKLSSTDDLEKSYEGLFLVCIFDRLFMKQAGAAVDQYYISPKDFNKRKALAAIKEMNYEGYRLTFAYAARAISKILSEGNSNIQFLRVIQTTTADEAFLQHKLNKERKHPHYLPIDARFVMTKLDSPTSELKQLRYFFKTNPFFRLKYENYLVIKFKTVNLSLKFGVKGRNIAGDVTYRNGNTLLDINGQKSYKTHCQYHSSNPKFHDEIILELPYPLTKDLSLDFKFYHLDSKLQVANETNTLGTATLSLLHDGHIIENGEHKISIYDPIGKSSDAKSNLTQYNYEIIDEIWTNEQLECKTTNRTYAFFLRAIKKHGLTNDKFNILKNSNVYSIAERYMKINSKLEKLNYKDENHHDTIADCLVKLADFYIPSPDCRVQVLLELAQLHLQYQYASEAAVAQLTAAALVAEYLRVLDRLPNVFSDEKHPAKSFISACPSASSEVCPDKLLEDLPKIPGFCTTKYFCECGLIFIIQTTMDTCKRASLFELSTKIHSLLRPLIEYRHLWRVLEKHFQNGEISWSFLDQFGAKNDRSLGTYFRVKFQTGEIYIYREAQLVNLWQFSNKIKQRSNLIANGKPIEIINEGLDFNPDKLEKDKFYVHIKSVEQYFTPEEKKTRVTVFEQNHNVSRFYFDLPYSKTAQQSIEHCYLKRTIYTLPHPMPYIVSRVKIPPENIQQIDYTPIEYSCSNLSKQLENIKEATKRKDFKTMQLLLQGSLLVQVNEGPKKMAEVFLNGSTENQNTANLRRIFREFLKANEQAVKLHGEWVMKNPVHSKLQDEMEIGLNRLTSSLQPFLK
ncbi:Dedicator of cytokinesis family protein [Histomonas meleagridis]|uniref:Dedicator of cytokinesis family protein n=1 Tax=Histomonas meleagridis TaxID=135588 RepID=UPI00355A0AD4|nr:Dedicator of cytokinesis family protein [Histomonas meleagridis]KAH0805508.1 Dedicator of cytokinesis family protein [Histomonas meleagridis]